MHLGLLLFPTPGFRLGQQVSGGLLLLLSRAQLGLLAPSQRQSGNACRSTGRLWARLQRQDGAVEHCPLSSTAPRRFAVRPNTNLCPIAPGTTEPCLQLWPYLQGAWAMEKHSTVQRCHPGACLLIKTNALIRSNKPLTTSKHQFTNWKIQSC